MAIKEKINQYLNLKGISPTKAEVILNWGKGSLTKSSSMSTDKLEEFLLLFSDLSSEWLLRGKGEMIIQETSSNSLIEDLKAEINQLKGENKVMREMLNLNMKSSSEHTKTA